MAPPPPSSHQSPPPPPSIADIPEVLLEDIFLRLPDAADLARASTACASFRHVIAGHAFLRLYRVLHPPPLIGVLQDPFIPAQPPHPSATTARAFTGFNFSCSSLLPSTAGRSWSQVDFFHGRALLASDPAKEKTGAMGAEVCQFFVRELAVCDPVHRRYIVLPALPVGLKALVRKPDVLSLETFLAPGEDEDPLSFKVMCLAKCRMNLLLVVSSSSLDRQWHARTFDQWSAPAVFASVENSEHGLKLLVLDVCAMKFSVVDLPPDQNWTSEFAILETTEGTLGMLTKVYDKDSDDDPYWLAYSIMRNNQWHSEKVILLPVKRAVFIGVAGGYLLMEALYTTSLPEELKLGCLLVDVKTLQVELFAKLSKPILHGLLYAGFPPSLSAPTI
ncbi:hypothetical protein VPH35_134148 [Triticum aestivum]